MEGQNLATGTRKRNTRSRHPAPPCCGCCGLKRGACRPPRERNCL